MSGKIRELYDKSKLLAGSKLRKEADTLYYLAKKRLLLNIKGAFAAGENFVGKIGEDGRANLLKIGRQPNAILLAPVNPQKKGKTFYYYNTFNYPAAYIAGVQLFANDSTSPRRPYPKPPPYLTCRHITTGFNYYLSIIYDGDGNILSEGRYYFSNPSYDPNFKMYVNAASPMSLYNEAVPADVFYRTGTFTNFPSDYSYEEITTWTGNHAQFASPRLTSAIATVNNTFRMEDTAAYQRYIAEKQEWDNYEDGRMQAIADNLDVIRLNTGEVLYSSNIAPITTVLKEFDFPWDVDPLGAQQVLSPSKFSEHLINHRAWRNSLSEDIYQSLDSGVVPRTIALSIMDKTPFSRNVGIGSRWADYRIEQTKDETPSLETFTRSLYAKNAKGEEVLVAEGYCEITRVTLASNPNGYVRTKFYFNNFIALRPFLYTSYLNGLYELENPESILGFLFAEFYEGSINDGTQVINGTYDGLITGLSSSSATNVLRNLGYVPTPELPTISIIDLDLLPLADENGNIPPDTLTYDKDEDGDGEIEPSEKSPTSIMHWIGKGLSVGESICVFPLNQVSLIDGQFIDVGLFPQSYDLQRRYALRIYKFYRFTYKGKGEFTFVRAARTPMTGEDGQEILPYTEFVLSLNSGGSAIIVSNGTVYDDLLKDRGVQKEAIEGKYDAGVSSGNMTLDGLYEWCSMQT